MPDIQAALEGNEKAYERLVQRYQAAIARQMWRFTRERNQLNELVQDVFVEAYFSLSSYKGTAPFLSWLRTIATRVGYRFWKRQKKERAEKSAFVDFSAATLHSTKEPAEAAELLYQLLSWLEPKDRLILTLLYFEECDTREIAKRMGWSRSLVKVRAYRARQKLKSWLEEAGVKG